MNEMRSQVQDAIDELVESGAERGVQVAVYRHGEPVVDAAAGVADPAAGRPVTDETVCYNFSIVKGAAATIAHMLAERGLFGYDTPIVQLWPQFGAHGKDTVTVRHVLSHTAAVPGIPLDTTPEDLCDWDKMCVAIADSGLWWQPGTKVGYPAYTFGYIVGEAPGHRQADHQLYFGMPPSEHWRLARLEDAADAAAMMSAMPADLPMFKAGPPTLFPTAELGSRTDILTADIPAGGKTSALAIARMYAALLEEVDGVRLIPPRRLREATAPAASGVDEVFGMPSRGGPGRTGAYSFALELRIRKGEW